MCDRAELEPLLRRYGFHFSKTMGQNFLIDAAVPQAIAEASGADADTCVLEIGPGVGTLTAELAKRAGRVVSVELDSALLPLLAETMAEHPNVTILQGDILKLSLPALAEEHFGKFTPIVCANLPYNITTPVLTLLLRSGLFASVTVMIQREVARRVCAEPGSGDYGAFTLLCEYFAERELLFEVPPECFLPAPKVTSQVVRLTRRETPPVRVTDEALLFRVIRAAFAQRRKKLLNALTSGFTGQATKEQLASVLASFGLLETVRGETLSLAEFAAIAEGIRALLR